MAIVFFSGLHWLMRVSVFPPALCLFLGLTLLTEGVAVSDFLRQLLKSEFIKRVQFGVIREIFRQSISHHVGLSQRDGHSQQYVITPLRRIPARAPTGAPPKGPHPGRPLVAPGVSDGRGLRQIARRLHGQQTDSTQLCAPLSLSLLYNFSLCITTPCCFAVP